MPAFGHPSCDPHHVLGLAAPIDGHDHVLSQRHRLQPARGPLALPKPKATEETGGATRLLDGFRAEIEKKVHRLRAAAADVAAKPAVTDVLVRSVRIAEARIALARRQAEPPDILVEPQVGGIGTLEFHRAQEAIAAGYAATLKALG